MTIKQSVAMISAAIFALVLILVASSVKLTAELTDLLSFITGPAWSTADGAMEGTIGLQQQIIALQMLHQDPTQRAEQMPLLDAGTAMADESLARMIAAGLISQNSITELRQLKTQFDQAKSELVAAPDQQPKIAAFTSLSQQLLAFLSKLEEEGDSTVENQFAVKEQLESWSIWVNSAGMVFGILICLVVSWFARKAILQPLDEVNRSLSELSRGEGDLTVRLRTDHHNEFDQIAQSFNRFVGSLQQLIAQIQQSNQLLTSHSKTIDQAISSVVQSGGIQLKETSQVAAMIEQMTQVLNELSRHADSASVNARGSDQAIHSGVVAVQDAGNSMTKVHQMIDDANGQIQRVQTDSQGIVQMLEVIRSIAEQTNLLALNAAIEAARAGESGRGFAVVADEVRNLASRTQASTVEIEQNISKLSSGLVQTVAIMSKVSAESDDVAAKTNQALQMMQEMSGQIMLMNRLNTEVAKASSEQDHAIHEVSVSMQHIQHHGEDAHQQGLLVNQVLSQLLQQVTAMTAQLVKFKT